MLLFRRTTLLILALLAVSEAGVCTDPRRDRARQPRKILYYEGEVRWEAKFLRRAMAKHEGVKLVWLQRTAAGGGPDSRREPARGFPTTAAELFQYHGLILGSVEAAAFTPQQLQLMVDFVERRGGGLLLLGGRLSFAKGGWGDTDLAPLLPVELRTFKPGHQVVEVEAQVFPTPLGLTHPATAMSQEPGDTLGLFRQMPRLTVSNQIAAAKPGASVLLLASATETAETPLPVLVYWRHRGGKVVTFAAQDSWTWHMNVPPRPRPRRDSVQERISPSRLHPTFWQQTLGWLVDSAPDPVSVRLDGPAEGRVPRGEAVSVVTRVVDGDFVEVADATVTARLRRVGAASPPSSTESTLEWTGGNGEYLLDLVPAQTGLYEIEVEARRGTMSLGRATTSLTVTE